MARDKADDAAAAETLVGEPDHEAPVARRLSPALSTFASPESHITHPAPALPDASTRFIEEGEVARGGMGAILRVYDTVLQRRIAVKVVEGDGSALPVQRSLEEAQITAQLDHPNIVPVHDLGTRADGRGVYFAMKLVGGVTLRDRLAARPRPLSAADLEGALDVVLHVCDALSYAHKKGVVHCDVKAENIMVGSYGRVYLMDWGLARTLGEPPSAERGGVEGTPAYMAPEQAWARVEDIDERTDVFGLGGVLFEILTGQGPFFASTTSEALALARLGDVRLPSSAEGALPPGLVAIAMRALSADRDARYPTVDEMKRAIQRFMKGGGWFPTVSFAKGERLMSTGEAAETAFVVVSGRCEVFRDEGGTRRTLRMVGPGEVVGEMALLTPHPRSACVEALEPVVVQVITRESLDKELAGDTWARALIEGLANRFRELDQEVAALRKR